MSYRYKWKDIKEHDLYKRWKDRDYLWLLNELKKSKTVSKKHPLYEGRYDLRSINLRKTRLPNLQIKNCDLNNGQFYSSSLNNAIMEKSSLVGCDFASSNLSDSKFIECNFSDSNFKRANLSNALFQNCDCSGVDFSNTNLKGAILSIVIFDTALLWKCNGLAHVSGTAISAKSLEIDINSFQEIQDIALKSLIEKEGIIMKYEYDIAISFAGEDRNIAVKIADSLSKRDVRVFYDAYEKVDLWGTNLYDHLTEIYSKKAQFCLIIISEHYARKLWTNIERQAAQARAFTENEVYILPLKLDNTEIKGILSTVGYLNFKDYSISDIVTMLKRKLGKIP